MYKSIKIIFGFVLAISTAVSYAGNTGYANITHIGCVSTSSNCFVYIDKPVAGPDSCPGDSGRLFWNKNAEGGHSTLSLLAAASFAKKKVDFVVSGSCYSQATSHPTFNTFYVDVQ